MQKWGAAQVVKYHMVGVYQDTTFIASDGAGQADVGDRVVVTLLWKMSDQSITGTPVIQNFKSTMQKVRDRAATCLAPVLKGEYEHYELMSVKSGLAGALEFTASTTYPVVEVAVHVHRRAQAGARGGQDGSRGFRAAHAHPVRNAGSEYAGVQHQRREDPVHREEEGMDLDDYANDREITWERT